MIEVALGRGPAHPLISVTAAAVETIRVWGRGS